MASDESFVQYIVEQVESAGHIRYRKMFGEYALYCDEKVIALICDNQLFVKPTSGGKAFIGDVQEGFPYPGAKPYFMIDNHLDDLDWMSELVKVTAAELPVPKPKKKK